MYAIVGVEVIRICNDVIIGDDIIDDVAVTDAVGMIVCIVKQTINSIYGINSPKI